MGAVIPPVVKARKNSTGTTFVRPRINIIEGTNVTVTMTDDPTNNEIDIEIAASGGGGGGSGTVTNVSVTTANGISGTVATSTTTPAISLSLGDITPSSVNGVAISGSSAPTLSVTGASSISGTNTGDVANTAITTNPLSQFAVTTSSQLAGVISDETGSGSLVFGTSPTLTTPVLGAATATSINKVIINAPATSATLTIADGKTLTANNTLTFTGTDTSSIDFGSGGTVAYIGNNLSVFSSTTSAQLASIISDETGSGALVFASTPTLVTPILGVATATSINGLTITSSTGTLTVTNGKTASFSNTLTFTGTDASSIAFGTGGTVAYTANKLSAFSATSSSELAGVISDETGTGSLVFANTPTLTTPGIASFTNATHSHLNSAGGGTITADAVSDFDTRVRTSRLDQMAQPTADVSLNTHKLTGVANGTASTDAVNLSQLSAITSGLLVRNNCRLASTANITGTYVGSPTFTLTEVGFGALSIDGVTPSIGDRVLLKDQTDGKQNGIYTVTVVGDGGTSYVLTRATDFDSSAEILTGAYTFITAGSVNASYGYYLTTPATITLDTTSLSFSIFISASAYVGGAGLTLTGLTFAVGAGTGITVNADDVAVDTTVVATTTNVLTMSNKTFTAPVLGAATATSINKVAFTTPATSATLTIADGKTLTASNTLTFTGTDSSSIAFGTGGTVAYVANKLSAFAATTSAELAGVISDETGSGSLVFGAAPSIATLTLTGTTPLTVTQTVATTGSPKMVLFTGAAHTTLTASVEASDVVFNLARTVQWATGAITTQRAFYIQAPVYNTVGVATFTTSATFAVSGAPTTGGNVVLTNAYSIMSEGGNVCFTQNSNNTITIDFLGGNAVSTNRGVSFKGALSAAATTTNFVFNTTGTTRTAGKIFDIQNNVTSKFSIAWDGGTIITQSNNSSGAPAILTLSGGSHSTLTAAGAFTDVAFTLNRTVQMATGSVTTAKIINIVPPTLSFVGASVITNAATVYIENAPQAGTNATITNQYALYCAQGNVAFGGDVRFLQASTEFATIAAQSSTTYLIFRGNQSAAGTGSDTRFASSATRTAGYIVQFSNVNTVNNQWDFSGAHEMIQIAASGGTQFTEKLTSAAHTAQTASTESPEIIWDLSATKQFATGALTTQRSIKISAPTYSAVGASVITNAATLSINAAPTAGTNVTITNAYSIWVNAGNARFDASVISQGGTAIPAGGTAGSGYMFSSTANFGIFFGSGVPTLSAAKGSLYLRSDGAGVSTRAYINTNGSTTWTAITTVA